MKGVILAGGQGTRLRPLTLVTNKHLLPVYNKPMIYYPLERMRDAGIRDVLIVSGKEHAGQFLTLLRSGEEFGLRLSYAVQEESGGIAQALSLAEDFADGGNVLVILGDNIFEDSLKDALRDFSRQGSGAKIFLKEVAHPEHYGVPRFDGSKHIEEIVEKPQNPPSRYAVIGVYLYDKYVFEIIRQMKPSGRGELEITDVNNFYITQGNISYEILEGWWGDGGESVDTLLEASLLASRRNKGMGFDDGNGTEKLHDPAVRKFLSASGKLLLMENGQRPLVVLPLAEYERMTEKKADREEDESMRRLKALAAEIERVNKEISRAQALDLREEVIAEDFLSPEGDVTIEPFRKNAEERA